MFEVAVVHTLHRGKERGAEILALVQVQLHQSGRGAMHRGPIGRGGIRLLPSRRDCGEQRDGAIQPRSLEQLAIGRGIQLQFRREAASGIQQGAGIVGRYQQTTTQPDNPPQIPHGWPRSSLLCDLSRQRLLNRDRRSRLRIVYFTRFIILPSDGPRVLPAPPARPGSPNGAAVSAPVRPSTGPRPSHLQPPLRLAPRVSRMRLRVSDRPGSSPAPA